MICTTCLHSLTQTFINGEQAVDAMFCKLLMRDMKGNLVKCGGYEKTKVEYVNFTPYVAPADISDPANPKTLSAEPINLINKIYDRDLMKWIDIPPPPKPLTRSERMKEYWRNRKLGNAKDGERTDS